VSGTLIVFDRLCRLLCGAVDPESLLEICNRFTAPDWQAIVLLANRHRVTPALWRRLREAGADHIVEPIARAKIYNVYKLNERRNTMIKAQITEAAEALNTNSIAPVLLKTAVKLVERPEDEIGSWVTRDIDMLVEPGCFSMAVETIKSLGYTTKREPRLDHSYPALYRPGSVVSIDLHKDIGPQRRVLGTSDGLASAQLIGSRSQKIHIYALSPTHQLVHLIFHAQLQDRRHELGQIDLHPMLNFADLLLHQGDRIDWKEVSMRFGREGYTKVLNSYYYLGTQLLGLGHPEWPSPDWRVKFHYTRCRLQLASPRLNSAITLWNAATPMMDRAHIQYRFGYTGSRLQRGLQRAQFGWDLVKRNRFEGIAKIRRAKERLGRK
jgi:putative nucleotidyltransferase-like protein